MSIAAESMVLEVPADVARQLRAFAAESKRDPADLVIEQIRRMVQASQMKTLSDEQILAICDQELPADIQEELWDLLEKNRERQISDIQRVRLDELMQSYREGLVRKAKAWEIAHSRGLRSL